MSYRNVVYDTYKQQINLFTWDSSGKRVMRTIPFEPYLYVEDPKGSYNTIFGTKARLKEFNNSWERYKFLKDSRIKRVYENFRPEQQYLLDTYWQENEEPEFMEHPLKVMFLDIETYSVDGFPQVMDPQHPVNVITCYDSLSKRYTTFGTGSYTPSRDDVDYHECDSERQLFLKFLLYLEEDYPDIISGWNSEGFDIPYIVNRMALR